MEKFIFMPNDEEFKQLFENAWQNFCKQGNEAGYNLNDDTAGGFIKEMFISGYCFGYNDTLNIIRDQLNAAHDANELLKN